MRQFPQYIIISRSGTSPELFYQLMARFKPYNISWGIIMNDLQTGIVVQLFWVWFFFFFLRDIKLQSNDLRNCIQAQHYEIFSLTIWTIIFFFVLLFKLVGGRNVRARLLPQIYVALLTPPGSGFKRWQGSQIGKEKKGLVKWGLITIFCLLKNISEETSDFSDTLSLSLETQRENH